MTLSLDPSNEKILRIDPPEHGYAPGKEYLLFIHNNWTGKSGRKLRQGIQMAFRISETPITPSPTPPPPPSPNPTPNPAGDFIFDKTTGTITGYRGKATNLVIPEQIDGVTVQFIGRHAFTGKPFTAVTIPDSVTAIGDRAFLSCQNLRSLSLGNNLDSIGELAFTHCKIDSLTLPASLRNIHRYAFYGNKMHTLNFAPNGKLEIIHEYSFYENNISSLTIPSYVRTIKTRAFHNSGISTLVFENGIQNIESSSFTDNAITSLIIPDSVQHINYNAFADNPLVTAELPQHTIADGAFPDNTKVIRRP